MQAASQMEAYKPLAGEAHLKPHTVSLLVCSMSSACLYPSRLDQSYGLDDLPQILLLGRLWHYMDYTYNNIHLVGSPQHSIDGT